MQQWIATNAASYRGQVVGNGHCVAYVREASGLGHTSTWRRGARARDGGLPIGTAIATFDAGGRYENDTSGRSHAAILVGADPVGLLVWDQWVGHVVQMRTIRFRGGAGQAVNDGDAFYAIETADPEAARVAA
jgi:hypothetical protein